MARSRCTTVYDADSVASLRYRGEITAQQSHPSDDATVQFRIVE